MYRNCELKRDGLQSYILVHPAISKIHETTATGTAFRTQRDRGNATDAKGRT